MNLSVIFSKLKPLFPVAVVASSIVITVKLLTSETPLTSEILKVEAKEDIHVTDFKDELVTPEEPPEEVPPEKEPEEKDSKKDEENDDEGKQEPEQKDDGEDENQQDSQEPPKDEQKKDEKQDDQKKSKPRKLKPNNPLSDMLSKILSPKG